MKSLFSFLLLALPALAGAQQVKVFNTRAPEGGYLLYVSNPEWYPVTIRYEFRNAGLRFSEGARTQFVVPARADSFRIGELKPEPGATQLSVGYRYFTAMGEVAPKARDRDYVYDLPFAKGQSFTLYQGYNGSFSHQGENALDFMMPEGTPVLAVRAGTVVQVVQENDRSCATADCKQYNNFITILHADGTFATYVHIRKNGALVKPGDAVKAGDPVAESGNVGWSNGPHLHLAIFTGSFDKWNTLPVRFRVDDGRPALLREGSTYSRAY
ncbi:MAG: M23 family metallopeptidase [Chitinophagaceae bacterium]|nr:MAG: M23 family metallopeptidase [Chitinophagaceae bacterium]